MDSSEFSLNFLQVYLPRLPWSIIKDVLLHLPAHIIQDVLLRVPHLRSFIIELYYSNEIHLILSPAHRPHLCVADSQTLELIDISTYGEIDDFLDANPEIVPNTFKVITSQDVWSLESLLQKHAEHLSRAFCLQIYVDKHELTEDQLSLLFSFPNLVKLQTSRVKFISTTGALSRSFETLQSLKEVVLLGNEIADWSLVKLPPNLEHLDVSWFASLDVTSIQLPDSLVYLYWNQVGLHDKVFKKLLFPRSLRTLMLTYNSLHSINVSLLPQSLETIDLSSNSLREFTYVDGHAQWPPNLESIILNNNLLDDDSLKQLRQIEWPSTLKNLRLDVNNFTSLEYLDTLPDGLKYLDLSESSLRSFRVKHNPDDYPFFVFPPSLDLLNIQCCKELRYDSEDGVVHTRIRFPDDLSTLNLTESNCEDLVHFYFPSKLQSLALAGNRLKDLNSYNLSINGKDIINWSQLQHLKDLDLFYNLIDGLLHWEPPKSLLKLDLRRNQFKILTSVSTPLFNRRNAQFGRLRVLNLEQNLIHTIDPDFCLPQSLQTLNLSGNSLSQFNFTENIANHPSLRDLDLSRNQIEKLSIIPPEAKYHSSLARLNFTKNLPSFTADTFYCLMDQLGLEPIRKRHNIKTEHLFE